VKRVICIIAWEFLLVKRVICIIAWEFLSVKRVICIIAWEFLSVQKGLFIRFRLNEPLENTYTTGDLA